MTASRSLDEAQDTSTVSSRGTSRRVCGIGAVIVLIGLTLLWRHRRTR